MSKFSHRFAWAALFALVLAVSVAQAGTITFNYTGAVVNWTVPTSGTYYIAGAGAQGGPGADDPGGLGAWVGGDVYLTGGTQLGIAVGGMGFSGGIIVGVAGGGGGGGSFVWVVSTTSPLLAVGGGGGAGYCCGYPGGDGQITVAGQNGFGANGGAGGTGGSGGAAGFAGYDDGAGGAGWLGNGQDATGSYITRLALGGSGPLSFAGGEGDGNQGLFADGGFGGGGGGGWQGGGGGGGCSGGGGGDGATAGGGGGGSCVDSSFSNVTWLAGANAGDGYVTITSAIPEPGTLIMFGSGLLGLAGIVRRKLMM